MRPLAQAVMLAVVMTPLTPVSAHAWGTDCDQRYPATCGGAGFEQPPARLDANGNFAGGVVRSQKTGATARVSPRYAAEFQAYVNDLEWHGAVIYFMGGNRRGRCSPRHMHSCGRALDVCQLGRGRVDASCHLPDRQRIAGIAEWHGLFEGGRWCSSDYGHAQAGVSAPACGSSTTFAARRHRHHRNAQSTNNGQ